MWRDVTRVAEFSLDETAEGLDFRIQRWIDDNSKALTVNYGEGSASYPPQIEKVSVTPISLYRGQPYVLVIVVFGVFLGE